MKKPSSIFIITIVVSLLFHLGSYAQNLKAFTPRFDQDLNGNMLLIGNNILSKDNSDFNVNEYNSRVDMKYVDIDGDPSTFSSSSATLSIPNPSCAKVRYAGLYWSALLQSGSRTDINKVKFKTPSAGYTDITGSIIWDESGAALGGNHPYACYADVTALVAAGLSGNYTVANVVSSLGYNPSCCSGTGLSAGWSLVIIYEDPTLSARSITTFDGFSGISTASGNLNIPVSGFRTIPNGPVRAQYAFSALEGDKPITGDFIMINGTKITPASRPRVNVSGTLRDNFFNSTITNQAGVILTRVPASTNTLGFDAGILDVPNPSTVIDPGGSVIKNKDTNATMTMGTTQDTYFLYFNAFAVEIIEPNIVITKVVQDALGNDVSNANVTLGQELFYEIEYQNKGNDDAVNFTIKDILPLNTIFKTTDLDLTNSGGVTYVYDVTTRTIIFTIPDSAVQENDPKFKIRFKVQVVPTCNELSNACSNIIQNQAFGNYKGRYSGNTINQDPSIPSASPCLFAVPSPTNFLVGLDGCVYTRNEILCGATTTLNAASGYSTYSWSKNADGSNPFAFTQSITVSAVGTYYVRNTAVAPCLSITEIIIVSLFGGTVTNPVLAFADQVVTCPNDGKLLPLIFLCGGNATKLITSGISDGSTIVWEKLNENASCPTATSTTVCANESNSCTWTPVGTGQDFLANAAGQYRMVLNYPGGCFNRFYFNVFQNLLNPTAAVIDKVCTTAGQITVGGVPLGYEYSLDGTTYQDSNVFVINTGGIYTVFIKQKGVTTNPCVFTVPNVFVRERDFTVDTFVTPPLCNGGKGSVKFAANDVLPQYFYKISQGGITVNSVGPILASDYTFGNLLAGTYQAEVSTSDGCISNFDVIVPNTPLLQATAAITIPLTCNNGEVTVSPTGGTAPYFYFVNSTTVFQGDPKIVIPAAGVYNIDVVDANNCTATTSISVAKTPAPTFNVTKTDVLCVGTNTGTITFGSIVTNGNALRYAIDVIPGTPAIPGTPDTAEIPGTPPTGTFVSSPVFTGLAPGTYTVAVEYTISGQVCYSNLQTVTINPVTAITGTATLTKTFICGQNGEITATASGGVGPYSTSIDGVTFNLGQLVYVNLTNGTYSITIKDANGCTFVTNSVTIDPLTPPTDLGFSATALSCPSKTATVTITPTGGFGALTYTILPALPLGVTVVGNVFSGLVAGTYTFQVTDAKNCSFQKDFSIAALPALTVVGQLVSNVKCWNTNTGAVKFTVSNFGVGGYTYTINDGTTTSAPIAGPGTGIIDLINQPAGTYTIVVTDVTTTCTATIPITVANAPANLATSIAVNPIKCLGVNGSVTVTASGGWGGYFYALTQPDLTVSAPQVSTTFANLTQTGNYTVSTTDGSGCVVSNTFALSTPINPTASVDPLSDLCFDGVNAASIKVLATGAVGRTLEYNINGGTFQVSSTFANLIPGNYTIIVRDDYGCSVTLLPVTIAPQLVVSTVLTKDLDCTGSPAAVITSTITGGTAPYKYQFSFNGGAFSPVPIATGTPLIYTILTAGTYQFRITDAIGCTVDSAVITVNPIVNPSATLTITKPSCNGFSDGSIQIVPSGGVGPYTYSFNGSPLTTTSLYTNLRAGISYPYEVRDSKNCPFVSSVTLTEPTALVATATATAFTCDATNTKQAAVITIAVPTTGTLPYQYSFNGSAAYTNVNTLTVNDTGVNQTITFSVKDANGCIYTNTITILKLNPPTDITFAQARPITCVDLNSDVTITAIAGVAPFQYEVTSPIVVPKQLSPTFAGLLPKTYIFKVTDVNGCYFTKSYIVPPVVNIAVAGLKLNDVDCSSGNNGAIRYTVSGNAVVGAYTFNLTSLSTGATTATVVKTGNVLVFNTLVADTYSLTVTDNTTLCTATAINITITQPLALTLVTATNINANCTTNAQVSVTAGGGTPNYTYAFKVDGVAPVALDYNASNSAVLDPAISLLWDVWVKDAKGCTTKLDVTIVKDALPTVTPQTPPCFTGAAIPVTITGTFVGTPTYSIGFGYQASNVFSITTAGNYTLSIKDGNGCIASIPYAVLPKLALSAVLDKDITCSLPAAAQITLTASGGNGTYAYEYSLTGGAPYTPMGTNVLNTLAAGSYIFKVTSNGCTDVTAAIVVNTTVIPTATVTAVNPTCNGSTDGSIKLVGSGGEAPYTYSISGVVGLGAANVFGGLSSIPGIYNYIIRDKKGCDATGTVTLINPVPIVASIAITAVSCAPVSPGGINVSITSGGVAPFTYTLYSNTFAVLNTSGPIAGTSYNFGGLIYGFGDYYITIVDKNGCEFKSVKQRIVTPPFIDNVVITLGATCAAGATVVVTSSLATGVPNFIYSIVGNPLSTLGVAIMPSAATPLRTYTYLNVPQGTYLFKVTDSNGCEFIIEQTIPPISGITVAVTAITNVSCNVLPIVSNGTVNFTVSGYSVAATDISYQLYNPITNLAISPAVTIPATGGTPILSTISGLNAGDYVLKVVEVGGTSCSSSINFSITQPTPLTAIISNEVNANCNTGAHLTIAASGGTGPYQYAFVANGVAQGGSYGTNSFATLNPPTLNWDIWVKDANGCEFKIDHLIIKDAAPTIIPPALQCYSGSPLSIIIGGSVTIGTATYSIGGAFKAGNSFILNASGTYPLTIKDGNGCTATVNYAVAPQLLLNAVLTKEMDCTATPTATITLNASGGTGAGTYSYEVSINGTPYIAAVTPYAAAVAVVVNTYTFRVTDTQTCQAVSNGVIVAPTITPTFSFTKKPETCITSNDGTITVTPTAGVAPFTYSKDGGTIFQLSNVFTGLNAAGIYNVVIKDSKGCLSAITLVPITEPSVVGAGSILTTPLSCGAGNAANPALVTVTGTGGTGSYLYSFDGGVSYSTANTYQSFAGITFNVFVKDTNGCLFSLINGVNIPALVPPSDLVMNTTVPNTCIADATVVIATTTGGVGALLYETSAPSPLIVGPQASTTFAGLPPGTYLFKVTDANNCTYQESYTVLPVVKIAVAGQLISGVTCNGLSTGAVTFTVTNFAPHTYSYSINGVAIAINQNASTIALVSLPVGPQKIDITDQTTGCTATTTILVSQPPALALAIATNKNANCNFDAQVSVTASGGTSGYRYSFVPSPAIAGAYSTSNSAVLNPATPTWTVWVKDANGCSTSTPVNVTKDAAPTVIAPALQCYTGTPLIIVVGGTTFDGLANPATTYSIGGAYQTSNTFNGITPGLYNLSIKDGNGCIATTTYEVKPQLFLNALLTQDLTCLVNANISLTPNGGIGGYTYEVSFNAGAFAAAVTPFVALVDGTYQFRVTDSQGCTALSNIITVTPKTTPALSFTQTNVNCNGGNDGTITVTGLMGIAPYTYSRDNGATFQASNLFTGLNTAGVYNLVVKDSKGCISAPTLVTITQLGVLTISSATATAFTCVSNKTSTITIIATGGKTIYTYSIDGINYFSSNTFTVIDKQDGVDYPLTVYVKDRNGCPATGSVNIDSLLPLTAAVNSNAAIDCNDTGSIVITVNGGSGNYSYQLLPSGVPQSGLPTSNIFPITTPGDYYFQVNDVTTGCTFATAKYTVLPFNTINVVATPTASVTCFGDSNGTAVITISGYTGTYDYQVLDSSGNPYGGLVTGNSTLIPLTIIGLTGGSYTVQVTETATPFCTFTSNVFTIASPATLLSVIALQTADVTCLGNQGTIVATGIGGWGVLEYELVGPVNIGYSPNSNFSNLPAGNYTVNVKDAKSCIGSSNVVLGAPIAISFNASAKVPLLNCFGDTNAIISVTNVLGGKGSNYSFTLNTLSASPPTVSGPQASPVFGGLGAGRYSVTVDDEWNCTQTSAPIIIDEPAPVTASLMLKSRQTCLLDPIITLTASGGTAPYTYADGLGTTIAFGPSVDINIPRASLPITSNYIVTDANGCKSFVSNDILVEPLEPLGVNLDLTNAFISCKGDASGVITANAKGGLGLYTYILLDGAGNPLMGAVQNSPGVFTQLLAGFYQVQVNSGNDCQIISNRFEIKEPAVALTQSNVVTNVLCNGNKDGQIVITAQGGTGVIKYAITPNLNKFVNQNTFNNLAPGSYQYIVQDQAGCFQLIPFDITEPNVLTVATTPNSIVPEICFGDKNGEFKVDIAGGTQQYSTSLDNVNGVYTLWPAGQTQINFTGLIGGSHAVYVKDANGCAEEWTVVLPPSVFLDPKAIVDYACVNNAAGNTVTASIDNSNNPADVDYALDGIAPYQASNVFVDVAPGTHFIQARHTNGCIDTTDSFDIKQIDPLTLSLSPGTGLNQIVATASGGSGIYQFTLNGESYGTQNKFIYYRTGDYTVAVTDSYGCTAIATMYFEFIDIEIPNVFTPNGSGTNITWNPKKTDNYPDMVCKIYDRYGRVIATLGLGQSWDGNYHAFALPMGDYWYVLKLRNTQDDREFVGHFTLYR